MSPTPSTVRLSRIAYVVAKLRVCGDDYLLLNAHRKWGDWSFPGGHVEPSDADFWAAAVRETTEELEPLRDGVDWEIEREPLLHAEWGPIASKSAGGVATIYQAAFHCLRFKVEPRRCLDRLPEAEFRLIRVREVEATSGVASVVTKLGDLLPDGWAAIPLGWDGDLGDTSLRGPLPTLPAR
jgi:8-oxo-dGTP pyrophosphatase MutT (NUDIX family)